MKFRKAIAGILCIIIFIMSTGCSGVVTDPVEQVINAINSSEYLTANEIYYESISGNLQLESEVENQLSEIISNVIESYNKGETTYDEAELTFEVIERADIYSYSLLLSSYAELENLQTSKNYYEEAVALEESGEYLDAYEAYEKVSTDDTNYESAQSKREEVLEALLDSLITEADELVANGEYETAQTILLSYLEIYIGDDEYWAELDFVDNSCMEALIADVEVFVAEGNYSEAYDVLLNEYSSFDFEGVDFYDAEVTKVSSLWETAIIKEAEEAFGTDKDYEAAILVLQHSGLVTDNINAKIAEYQEYIPIALTSLDYIRKGGKEYVGTSLSFIYTDVQNNTYDKDNIIYEHWFMTSSSDESNVVYYLGSEYSKLSGTLFRAYGSLNYSENWTGSVKIYGDGVLLYESYDITSSTYEPVDFEVDVTGVRELEIRVEGRAKVSGDEYALVCAANLMLSK